MSDGAVRPSHKPLTDMQVFLQLLTDGLESCTDIALEMGTTKGWVSKLAKKAERAEKITIKHNKYKLL